jgi:uncharacterized protein
LSEDLPIVDQALSQYRELCQRLDAKFSEIQVLYPSDFACRKGCHSCCAPGLTVNRLEAEAIARFLGANPELAQAARENEQTKPHGNKRCAFLGKEGDCLIYQERPVVCRSHGAPIQMRPAESGADENLRVRDVCSLNFKSQNLMELPPASVLNVDTVNVLLALLAKRGFPGSSERIPLKPKELLSLLGG